MGVTKSGKSCGNVIIAQTLKHPKPIVVLYYLWYASSMEYPLKHYFTLPRFIMTYIIYSNNGFENLSYQNRGTERRKEKTFRFKSQELQLHPRHQKKTFLSLLVCSERMCVCVYIGKFMLITLKTFVFWDVIFSFFSDSVWSQTISLSDHIIYVQRTKSRITFCAKTVYVDEKHNIITRDTYVCSDYTLYDWQLTF